MAKQKFPTPKAPRSMADLNQLYGQLVSKLGENNLHINRIKQQNDTIIAEINVIEEEAKQSQELEKKTTEVVVAAEEEAKS